MIEIKIIKTKWWKMIKVKKRCKKFNKKYGNKSYTPNEINSIWSNTTDYGLSILDGIEAQMAEQSPCKGSGAGSSPANALLMEE